MSNQVHPFQQWLDDNGVVDVRFYPANPSESSANQLLDDAMKAVTAFEQGKTVPYEYSGETNSLESH